MNKLLPILLFCTGLLQPAVSFSQPGTVTLKDGSGQLLSTYATIQSAYDAIPSPLTQPYRIEVSYAYSCSQEHLPIVFTEKAGAGATHVITIVPDPATPPIAASITGRTDRSPLLVFDGATWITINGNRPGGFPAAFGFADYTPYGDTILPPATFPNVSFINGASHNQLLYCTFSNRSDADTPYHDAAAVLLGGTSNARGNDSNLISHCSFNLDYNMLASEGDDGHPNTGNTILQNTFFNCLASAIHVKSGTARLTIHDNTFTLGSAYSSVRAIAFRQLADTSFITGNIFGIGASIADSELIAIQLAPGAASAANSYCLVANNVFMHTPVFGWDGRVAYRTGETDQLAQLTGLDLAGNGPLHAGIYHNTFRLTTDCSSGSSRSALLRYRSANSGNDVQVLNNIFANTRAGGTAHLVMDLSSTSGIATDYNNYSSGARLKTGNTLYPSLAAWKAAMAGRDAHSSDDSVLFEQVAGDQLSGRMYRKAAVQGIALNAVGSDRLERLRSYPYMGACELIADCSPASGLINGIPPVACSGEHIYLRYTPSTPANGIVHQWQQRGDAPSPFADIPGMQQAELFTTQTGATIYRVKDSCIATGRVSYSNILRVDMRGSGHIDSLTEAHSGSNYAFTLHGATVKSHLWLFGDGTSKNDTNAVLSHTYTAPGTYPVTVISQEGCTGDTLTITIHIYPESIGQAGPEEWRIYPNPAGSMLYLSAPAELGELSLMDGAGRILQQRQVLAKETQLNVQGLPAGCYYLRSVTQGGVWYRPVMIAH